MLIHSCVKCVVLEPDSGGSKSASTISQQFHSQLISLDLNTVTHKIQLIIVPTLWNSYNGKPS